MNGYEMKMAEDTPLEIGVQVFKMVANYFASFSPDDDGDMLKNQRITVFPRSAWVKGIDPDIERLKGGFKIIGEWACDDSFAYREAICLGHTGVFATELIPQA